MTPIDELVQKLEDSRRLASTLRPCGQARTLEALLTALELAAGAAERYAAVESLGPDDGARKRVFPVGAPGLRKVVAPRCSWTLGDLGHESLQCEGTNCHSGPHYLGGGKRTFTDEDARRAWRSVVGASPELRDSELARATRADGPPVLSPVMLRELELEHPANGSRYEDDAGWWVRVGPGEWVPE